MNKSLIILSALLLPINLYSDNRLITFTNPAIHSLDGVTFMLDGAAIHDILLVIRKVMSMQNGQKVGSRMEGFYQFGQEKLSIAQLAEVEQKDPNNPNLAHALQLSKHDFIKTTEQFMKGIEPAKRLMLDLIKEFCEKRNRPDSVILAWTNAKHGNEAEVFSDNIRSFASFELFLTDLTFFLKDLVNSCPKAREQYKEWYKKQKQSQDQ